MSIYVSIPGMQMPKVCNDCLFDYDNISCVVLNKGFWREDLDDYKGKLPDCPLVEVTPHGRLIDADMLCDRLLAAWDIADKEKKTLISEVIAYIVTPIVVGTPTIIPAEGGADG